MSARPTKGPCREWHGDIICAGDAASDYDDYVIAGLGQSFGSRSSPYSPVKPNTPEGKANGNLIVDAFNVYQETQLTPRELADQRAELIEIVETFLGYDDTLIISVGGNPNVIEQMLSNAHAVLAKCTGAA